LLIFEIKFLNWNRYHKKIFNCKYTCSHSFPRIPYWCARSSNWGDLLPMTVKDVTSEEW